MGNLATPKALIVRWDELCRDSSLDDLPYKVELSTSGKIELSPRTTLRGLLVADLAIQLQQELPGGIVAISCAVLTRAGVYVPDVVWVSRGAWRDEGNLLVRAPEICVEVCSLDAEDKKLAYLDAGAHEVWVVSEDASIRYFNGAGEIASTDFPVTLSWPPRAMEWAQ